VFFQDEARFGQKGRLCHRWWLKGQRPPGLCDQRFDWTYLYAAVEPMTGDSFALVLPTVSIVAMNRFLSDFVATLAPQEHAVIVLDGAGWHASKGLVVPDNVTLVPLPPYSPQCNPVERVWLFLREKLISLRGFPDQNAIIDARCDAWNAIAAETGRIKALYHNSWIQKVIS
jgi:hypothetical protein